MKESKLKTNSSLKDQLIDHLCFRISFTYRKDLGATTILAGEEYRFRTNSNQLYFIVFEVAEQNMYINIVCGGGGEGIFNFTSGSEKAFIKRTMELISEFCKKSNEPLEVIE